MSKFLDSESDQWNVFFDAFVLADAKKDTGVDLADVSAGGWAIVEGNAAELGRVLVSLCADEIKARQWTPRQAAKRLRGEAINAAREALRQEAADFFPQSEWSAIRSNLTKRTQMDAGHQAMSMVGDVEMLREMRDIFLSLPPEVQTRLIASGGDTSSLTSDETNGSASGPDATPSTNATDSPEKSELQPAA